MSSLHFTNGLRRYKKVFDRAAKMVLERDTVLEAVKMAMLTKQHVLMIGSPGVAKSKMVNAIFEGFEDSHEMFRIQCSKRMTEEYLVGPLNMALFRDTGEYRHLTDRSMVTAQMAFLDEFLDLPDQSLRSLLEILNERTFTRGKQREKCRLMTAIAATNFDPKGEQVEAVQDRFLYRVRVPVLNSTEAIVRMLESNAEATPAKVVIAPERFHVMQRRVNNVTVEANLLAHYAESALGAKNRLRVTDRRIAWGVSAIKASAFLHGRGYALPSDCVRAMEHVFSLVGDAGQSAEFAALITSTWSTSAPTDLAHSSLVSATDTVNTVVALTNQYAAEGKACPKALLGEVADLYKALRNTVPDGCVAQFDTLKERLSSVLENNDTESEG